MTADHSTHAGTPAAKKTYPAARPKVPPFARYKGTSFFRKDRRRAREYAWFLAHEKARTAAQS